VTAQLMITFLLAGAIASSRFFSIRLTV